MIYKYLQYLANSVESVSFLFAKFANHANLRIAKRFVLKISICVK